MRKDVMISIQGSEITEDEREQEVELITEGVLEERDGGLCLTYQESELTGMKGGVTMFHVVPGRVTLLRTGDYAAEMVFEEGKRHRTIRDTPMGQVEVGVQARHLTNTLGICGGSIEVDYSVEINHMRALNSLFRVNVRESECLPS